MKSNQLLLSTEPRADFQGAHIISKSRGKNAKSRSPRNLLANNQLYSHNKMKIAKLNSCQLFKEAHKINGETYLKETQKSALLPIRTFTIASKDSKQIPSPGKKSNLMVIYNIQGQNKEEVGKEIDISIINPEGNLTRLINQGVGIEEKCSFDELYGIEGLPEDVLELMKKSSSKKDDTLQQLLNVMKTVDKAK